MIQVGSTRVIASHLRQQNLRRFESLVGAPMPERSWASLAPLMDDRCYVESTVAAVKVRAHRDFRLCVTMNQDASVYELPGYIQSRLKPRIEVVNPPWALQEQILRLKCPAVEDSLLAAKATIGDRYAARVYLAAMTDRTTRRHPSDTRRGARRSTTG